MTGKQYDVTTFIRGSLAGCPATVGRRWRAGLALLLLFSMALPAAAQQRGSYATSLPEGCAALPTTIYKVAELAGPTPTNQWWSSLVWEKHSQSLFPHPLGMVCHAAGLSVSYPGAGIVGASGNIMGGSVSVEGDLVIGHSMVDAFPETKLAGFSKWFITTRQVSGEAKLEMSFGHGSPFVFCRIAGGNPRFEFAHRPQVWRGTKGDAVLGVTVRGNHYGLFGATGSTWSGLDDAAFVNNTDKDYFSIALLPDNRPDTLAQFAKCAHNHVMDTAVEHRIHDGRVEATYTFTTKSMEPSSTKATLYSLYPHQWKYTSQPLTNMSYRSVRGEMKVVSGRGFRTSVPIQGVLPALPAEGIANRDRMIGYLRQEVNQSPIEFADTYWEGKHLGKLATLSGIAGVMGERDLERQFVDEMRQRLENWFTASAGEAAPLFYYDKTWGTLIGSRPSYGTDSQLNDHHFHYGYFIRAAAAVARRDPAWAKQWGRMVELLIRDIASSDPADQLFPELRCFDTYAGHSWASGHARFGDGNNQESSSESMNAWYAMMLWGEVTGNTKLRDLGVFLYNTERTAVEEYWFDVSGTNFPDDFPNVALGLIWGGKGGFETWFSGEIDHVHGINWLPFTPASIYMGRHPDYVKRNFDRIAERREGGENFNNGWGDLVVMFGALNDPAQAVSYLDANPECKIESGNTHAFMYHWIHTLHRLGRCDPSVTADHPFVNVYVKDDKKTYAAYNLTDTPLPVRFSDQRQLTAAPRQMTVMRDP